MSNENGFFSPNLDTAAIGRPITRAGISFFPVYLTGNDVPAIATGPGAKRVIDELDDASVPDLTVTNPGKNPLLLVEGEQFLGGKQNRTINVSVLVAPGATMKIPVSCLEAGRWGRRRDFRPAATSTPRRVRRTLHDAVAAQAGTASARRGDQQRVWGRIDDSLREMRTSSPTAAIADADALFEVERDRGKAVDELEKLGPLPGAVRIRRYPRPAHRRHGNLRGSRTAETPLAGARPVLPARKADRDRLAIARPRSAGAPGHQLHEVHQLVRAGARSGTPLHQREGRRAGAHPRRVCRPRLGAQPVALREGPAPKNGALVAPTSWTLVGMRRFLNDNVIQSTGRIRALAANQIVQARIDGAVKEEAAAVLAAMGLTVSDAVRLLLTRVAHEKALPFAPLVPNAVTIEAMKEARKGGLPRFNSVQTLLDDLHADD